MTQFLTERECEVVQLLKTGKSNKEIASALKLSEGTIKIYLSRIFRKLHLGSRLAVALWAVNLGG